jgi:hypothetical protein
MFHFCGLVAGIFINSHKANYSLPQSIRVQETVSGTVLSPPVKAGSLTICAYRARLVPSATQARTDYKVLWCMVVCRALCGVPPVTEALTHGTISWKGKGERRTLLYKYAQSHVGYGNAPTVPANHSGVTLTEEQRRLFVGEQLSNCGLVLARTALGVCAVLI